MSLRDPSTALCETWSEVKSNFERETNERMTAKVRVKGRKYKVDLFEKELNGLEVDHKVTDDLFTSS